MSGELFEYTMTCEDVAKRLGYHVQYVRALAKAGTIPAIKRIRAWRFSEKELYKWLREKTKDDRHNGQNSNDGILR